MRIAAAQIARRILNAHFPESIRQDVQDAVGLCLDAENASNLEQAQRRRDPAFREKVLLACEYRCCVCGNCWSARGRASYRAQGGGRIYEHLFTETQERPGAPANRLINIGKFSCDPLNPVPLAASGVSKPTPCVARVDRLAHR